MREREREREREGGREIESDYLLFLTYQGCLYSLLVNIIGYCKSRSKSQIPIFYISLTLR
jgi:hypothetical protein